MLLDGGHVCPLPRDSEIKASPVGNPQGIILGCGKQQQTRGCLTWGESHPRDEAQGSMEGSVTEGSPHLHCPAALTLFPPDILQPWAYIGPPLKVLSRTFPNTLNAQLHFQGEGAQGQPNAITRNPPQPQVTLPRSAPPPPAWLPLPRSRVPGQALAALPNWGGPTLLGLGGQIWIE